MKHLILVIFIAILSFTSISCESDYNEFEEYLMTPYTGSSPLYIEYDSDFHSISRREASSPNAKADDKQTQTRPPPEKKGKMLGIAYLVVCFLLSFVLLGITGYGMMNTATIVAVANLAALSPFKIAVVARFSMFGKSPKPTKTPAKSPANKKKSEMSSTSKSVASSPMSNHTV